MDSSFHKFGTGKQTIRFIASKSERPYKAKSRRSPVQLKAVKYSEARGGETAVLQRKAEEI